MAAGLGFKTFTTGEVLTAGDVNGYLMQGVLVFASAAARNAAITSPQEGQFAFTKDTNGLWYYDGAAWVASGATGDIEGVTAGVGISGGGTSGTVTITNSMATEITAAGDVIVGTGSGTFDNLPIGTTGQVLTADTTVSPYKVKWAAPAAGGFVGVALYKNNSTSFTSPNYTVIPWNEEEFDTNTFHDNATNNTRITIPSGKAGYYEITAQATISSANTSGSRALVLFKNGTLYKSEYGNVSGAYAGAGQDYTLNFTYTLNLAVADYIEVKYYQNSGVTIPCDQYTNAFTATYLGA